MKLHEAIRLGAMCGHQVFGSLDDARGGLCAYGAALTAIGAMPPSYVGVPDEWLECGVFDAVCPACADSRRHVDDYAKNTIAHLNDTHRWSREQIADWVETIEAAQAQPVAVEDVAHATSR
jgi:hypothetical protein